MKKAKSKITFLIENIKPKKIKTHQNTPENKNKILPSYKSTGNLVSSISTYQSSIQLTHSNNINNKIELYIYYTLCEILYKKIKIIVHEDYSISSMISYTIDKINKDLIVNGGFKMNDNEELYEIRYAKKNGFPNYNKPLISKSNFVKNFPGMELTLCLKRYNNVNNNLFYKKIEKNHFSKFDDYFFQ